jgi:hypothetical protein
MVEFIDFFECICFFVALDDLDLVCILFNERSDREAKSTVGF